MAYSLLESNERCVHIVRRRRIADTFKPDRRRFCAAPARSLYMAIKHEYEQISHPNVCVEFFCAQRVRNARDRISK